MGDIGIVYGLYRDDIYIYGLYIGIIYGLYWDYMWVILVLYMKVTWKL